MNGDDLSAQRCTIVEEFANAIGVQDLQQLVSARFPLQLPQTEVQNHLWMMIKAKRSKGNHEFLMNDEKSVCVNCEILREFVSFLLLDLRIVISLCDSVTISFIYDALNPTHNQD